MNRTVFIALLLGFPLYLIYTNRFQTYLNLA